jgi:hypothetical protein
MNWILCARFTPDARHIRTQMLRTPAARGARNKVCYFCTPLYQASTSWIISVISGSTQISNLNNKLAWFLQAKIYKYIFRQVQEFDLSK